MDFLNVDGLSIRVIAHWELAMTEGNLYIAASKWIMVTIENMVLSGFRVTNFRLVFPSAGPGFIVLE